MKDIFQETLQYWDHTKIKYNSGLDVTRLSLHQQEKFYAFPEGLKSLLLVANGFEENTEYDAEGFRFYSLVEVYMLRGSELTIFADYLHESWLYGINETGVFWIGAGMENKKLVSHSMEIFLELYIGDSNQLYVNL